MLVGRKFDRVLVTGGAGFIGSHTVDALLNEEVKVWILDDLSSGSLRNIRHLRKNPQCRFKRGSITNYRAVESLARKVDAIIHLAAVVSPFVSVKKPELVNDVNAGGTLNVLRAARKTGVKRVVCASSSSVYGNQALLPITETNPLQPITPYGVSKLAGEKYCGAFYQTFGLETICFRYFNVYGSRQSANPYSGVISIFANKLRKGLPPQIFGDGEQTRDFIHVSDVVGANLMGLQTTRGVGEAFNVGTGRATSINSLVSILAGLCEKSWIVPVHLGPRRGDIKDSYADVTRAKETLGFQSKVELREGLQGLLETTGHATRTG
jgi:UDP-glucose 4-epimerase